MKSKNVAVTVLLLLLFTTAGFISGRLTAPQTKSPPNATDHGETICDLKEKREGGKYRYINPLWECDNFNPSRLNSIVKLKTDVTKYIEETLKSKTATHVSVYFRDLNSGPWMGINEQEKFSPASLLKVPILIAVLKKCETQPEFLKKEILFSTLSQDNVNPNIVDKNLIQLGKSYAVEDLLHRMIAYSDNQAKELLIQSIGNETYLAEVFSDIGISIDGVGATDDFVSVKDYSSFFRLLYNATYLNKEMSEKALAILSQTDYAEGIVAGIPRDWSVAHKFGERGFENSNLKQLHDCGIIYKPGAPYLLCVMTRGDDFTKQASVIAGVSKIIREDIEAPQQ